MSPASTTPTGRIAFRCDGDAEIGAGHVGRCLPLAREFAALGWDVGFVGGYEALARWLIERSGIATLPPAGAHPCGVDSGEFDAAIVDSYGLEPGAICDLAHRVPVATIAEASRCPSRGILLDYHLDRHEPASEVLLAGAAFAPLDPDFLAARRPRTDVKRVLITLGGSLAARELMAEIVPVASAVFPDAELLVAGAPALATSPPTVIALPVPGALADIAPQVDLAITAAGLTAYELACAGIPQVAVAIVANQRRVLRGLRGHRLAICLDFTDGDSPRELPGAVAALRDKSLREALAQRGMAAFDGHGARRAACALSQRFLAQAARSGQNDPPPPAGG